LAGEPENHVEIVKSEGIESLLAVLRTDDIEAGRYAAFGLSNIAANANFRDKIVEDGGVPSLVSLACWCAPPHYTRPTRLFLPGNNTRFALTLLQ